MLVMLLAAASGCTTQQAKPAATVTTATTPVSPTEVPTVISTSLPVKVSTTAAAPKVTDTVTTVATAGPSTTFSKKLIIYIRNKTYIPDQLTVLPGTGVTWINDDSVIHIVRATGESQGKFTSAELINTAQFHYTFGEAPGTYEFGDPNYPEMKGTIIVKKGESIVGSSTAISSGSS